MVTNQTVAVKKIPQVVVMPEVGRRALREIKLLRQFRGHENVRGFLLPNRGRVPAADMR